MKNYSDRLVSLSKQRILKKIFKINDMHIRAIIPQKENYAAEKEIPCHLEVDFFYVSPRARVGTSPFAYNHLPTYPGQIVQKRR